MNEEQPANPSIIRGSCLCERVRYQVNGPLLHADHCHCSQCRRQHGAAFATYADFTAGDFQWMSGEALTKIYPQGVGAGWCFCSECGATLGGTENGEMTSITLGTVTGSVSIKPSAHIFVGSKASWYDIEDSLPQCETRE